MDQWKNWTGEDVIMCSEGRFPQSLKTGITNVLQETSLEKNDSDSIFDTSMNEKVAILSCRVA